MPILNQEKWKEWQDKNNDPYGYTGAFPNGALKAKTFGIEVANGKYTESFLIDTPDQIYTAKE